ncbi:HlyD family efflux transporter periplasmic adaptor subunit [Roseivivax marinus]|uniref:HlyD family efflux transporter periplasmic adaptor subunit n=1 Tax=Roseivivax marinus TaxID=1379903 RepID=UPI001F0492BC|nr:HlyD family efflux transporter periplasmic adaptor subunit [Roseivivax marinus]UMA65046.1 HlyD family efflux transporter periplasmic adaptor subunit [Roseivivax marinus]
MSAAADLPGQMAVRLARPSRMIRLVALAVVVFVAWAAVAGLDEIVRADGEVVSSSRPQIIQNLEGGILESLEVAEGDRVAQGAVVARLHATRYRTEVDDLSEQITALEIRRLRLEAELAGAAEMAVPAALEEANPDMAASERALLAARAEDVARRTGGADKVATEAATELRLLEDLHAQNAAPLIEVTRARKAHADAVMRRDEIVTQAELARAEAHAKTVAELGTLRQALRAAEDQLSRTVLRAPMDGVVKSLSVTTIGGVVRPGEEILQIVPAEDVVFVEARVAPKDIAHVQTGQPATVKLSAYDYTIWGTLEGRVEVVSADTFEDERRPEAGAHYRVTVRLTEPPGVIDLRPGMQAQAELLVGRKTVLHYLTKPLYKSREALREP